MSALGAISDIASVGTPGGVINAGINVIDTAIGGIGKLFGFGRHKKKKRHIRDNAKRYLISAGLNPNNVDNGDWDHHRYKKYANMANQVRRYGLLNRRKAIAYLNEHGTLDGFSPNQNVEIAGRMSGYTGGSDTQLGKIALIGGIGWLAKSVIGW